MQEAILTMMFWSLAGGVVAWNVFLWRARKSAAAAPTSPTAAPPPGEARRLDAIVAARLEAERRLDEARAELTTARRDRDEAVARLGNDSHEELKDRLQRLEAELRNSRAERDAARRRARELEDAETSLRAELATLRRDIVQMRDERDGARRDSRRQMIDARAEWESGSRNAAEQILRTNEERKQLQRRVAAQQAEIERLAGGGATESGKDGPKGSPKDSASRGISRPEFEAAMGVVRGATDGDDLKQIQGVGPAMERKLRNIGVTRFQDIQDWDDSVIDRIARDVGATPERIRRDNWVDQARRLGDPG